MKNQQCHTGYSTFSKTIQHRQNKNVDTQLSHKMPYGAQ